MLKALILCAALWDPAGPQSAWDDFPVFVWRQRYAEGPAPPELLIVPFLKVPPSSDQEPVAGVKSHWPKARSKVPVRLTEPEL